MAGACLISGPCRGPCLAPSEGAVTQRRAACGPRLTVALALMPLAAMRQCQAGGPGLQPAAAAFHLHQLVPSGRPWCRWCLKMQLQQAVWVGRPGRRGSETLFMGGFLGTHQVHMLQNPAVHCAQAFVLR